MAWSEESKYMKISYDHLTDTLYIFAGEQTDSIARDQGNGIILKFSKDKKLPIGAIIHDFEKRFKKEQQEAFELPLMVNA